VGRGVTSSWGAREADHPVQIRKYIEEGRSQVQRMPGLGCFGENSKGKKVARQIGEKGGRSGIRKGGGRGGPRFKNGNRRV